tara:strand:- start:19882 stop:20079 length:198 start_codon:yes stop_codon:yes gene_type:complete
VFWLDGFDGAARGGLHYRSKIALDIEEVEAKFGVKIVAIGVEPDENNAASWTIEFVTEVSDQEIR